MPKGGARPGAGRPKGTKNRQTAIEKVEEYLSWDDAPGPLEFLLEILAGRDPRRDAQIDLDKSIDAAKTLLRYLFPQISAVSTEISMADKVPDVLVLNLAGGGRSSSKFDTKTGLLGHFLFPKS